MPDGIMMRQRFDKRSSMAPRFEIGQKVVIKPAKDTRLPPGDVTIEAYAGQSGEVTDYYWINRGTEVFYIYTVQIGTEQKEAILHEDELEANTP